MLNVLTSALLTVQIVHYSGQLFRVVKHGLDVNVFSQRLNATDVQNLPVWVHHTLQR